MYIINSSRKTAIEYLALLLLCQMTAGVLGGPWSCGYCDPPINDGSKCCDACVDLGIVPNNPPTDGHTCTNCGNPGTDGTTACQLCPGTCTSIHSMPPPAPVHRFTDVYGDHVYSTNIAAYDNTGYGYETDLAMGFVVSRADLVPLTEFTIAFNNSVRHFYSTSTTEGAALVQKGYSQGPVICWVYPMAPQSPSVLTYPVYRYNNPGSLTSLLTINPSDVSSGHYWTYDIMPCYMPIRN